MKNAVKFLAFFSVALTLSFAVFAAPSAVTAGDTATEPVLDVECEDEEVFLLAGEGTVASPYIISSVSDFNNYANKINKSGSLYADKYYKLSGNIDFSGAEIVPFGVSNSIPFKGTLDGDGYALLNVAVPDVQNAGVIGYMTQGVVKNLRVSYTDMTQYRDYTSLKYFGGVVGYSKVASSKMIEISNCVTEGNLMIRTKEAAYFGGMLGYFKCENGNGNVSGCVSEIDFDVVSDKSNYVAGFVAYVYSGSAKDGKFTNCISYGNIKAKTSSIDSNTAGFVAYTNKDEGGWSGWAGEEYAELLATSVNQYTNCAAYGDVYGESTNKACTGGFVGAVDGGGDTKISNCYRNSSADILAVSNNVMKNNRATAVSEENFYIEAFYSDSLQYDLEKDVYMSNNRVCLRSTAKSYGSAVMMDTKDVRLTSKPGIRFRSEIDASKKDYVYEYGVIVTRKELLGTQELTLDFEGTKAVGVAYSAENNVDKFLEADDERIVFSAVVFNIKEEYYGTELAARTYIKYVCGEETVVVYGNTVATSINNSAFAVRFGENYEYLTDAQKELLETMLPKA